ncbi:MAG: glucose-1-phosphate adenylyltransferase [Bacillota bacterium]
MIKKEMIAMILAGGKGSRLKRLTTKMAKPAVPYGGKYRIIDFALSNCSNSGIDTIGVLTQYHPLALNAHIGIGKPWDLDRTRGGIKVLPPYVSDKGGQWFEGTAHAIYENIHFIEMYNPEYVLVLSGDHIYKMDYRKMLKFHKEKDADVTVSSMKVPLKEASRFGILNTEKDLEIYEFDEKPDEPKNDLASMGIYIFNWQNLKKYLEQDPNDCTDFGHDILPKMLADGNKMYAYEFEGYWRDVGTIESFWEGNMELLQENSPINIFDDDWRIYSRNANLPPQIVSENAIIKHSMVNEGCYIDGTVKNSMIFPNVDIHKDAVVKDSIIMPNVVIKKGAKIYKSIISNDIVVESGEIIGDEDNKEITLIAKDSLGVVE